MSSALAKQLRALQQADQALGGKSMPAGKKSSFLFDPKEAGDYDAEAIYALGINGLAELQQLNPVFLKYQTILFSSQAIDMDRSLLTASENREIDEQLRTFLRLVSPYFLQKPAHKVLEWLIRKYRINEMNVEACIDCILPYHETPAFVRMVQILYFTDKDRWGFLFDVKKNAKMVNRTYLALRCLADRSILDFVHESAVWHTEHADEMTKRNTHIVPFFTYLVLEYIQNIAKIELTHVTHLLPKITAMMKAKRTPDLQLSAFVLFMQLSERFSFAEKAIHEVAQIAAKFCAETNVTELIIMLATLVVDGRVKAIPAEIYHQIAGQPTVVAATKKASASHNIKPFASHFSAAIAHTSGSELDPLKQLLSSVS